MHTSLHSAIVSLCILLSTFSIVSSGRQGACSEKRPYMVGELEKTTTTNLTYSNKFLNARKRGGGVSNSQSKPEKTYKLKQLSYKTEQEEESRFTLEHTIKTQMLAIWYN